MSEFSERLDKYMTDRCVSSAELAGVFGAPRDVVNDWRAGFKEPNIVELIVLADYFGISVDRLMGHNMVDSEIARLREQYKELKMDNDHLLASLFQVAQERDELKARHKEALKNSQVLVRRIDELCTMITELKKRVVEMAKARDSKEPKEFEIEDLNDYE